MKKKYIQVLEIDKARKVIQSFSVDLKMKWQQ